jgi:hypothetical protein
MTDQHPLTDEIIEEIAHSGYIDDYGRYNYAADDMRAAADWQLEQVIEWLRQNLHQDVYLETVGYYVYNGSQTLKSSVVDVDCVIDDLKKAMRQQEDN